MYTQCPECESSFRVTADVLKQAAGMVRCGSCGNAFNSLDFLSEEKPGSPEPELTIPELTPDPAETKRKLQPKSISAAQSAALLKTLDQLAGEDIRIEDTGVEWRVLDDEDSEDSEDEGPQDVDALIDDPEVTSAYRLDELEDDLNIVEDEETGEYRAERSGTLVLESADDAGDENPHAEIFAGDTPTAVENTALFARPDMSTEVDELLQGNGSSTPIDEILHDGPGAVDSAEVFGGTEEMRFDDNTPLPDDFLDDVHEHSGSEYSESPPAPAAAPEQQESIDFQQAEFALGNPEDWEQLLSEVDDLLSDDSSGSLGNNGSQSPAADSIDDELMSAAFENEPGGDAQAREYDGSETSIDEDLMSAAFQVEEQSAGDSGEETDDDDARLGDVLDEASRLAESLNESLDDDASFARELDELDDVSDETASADANDAADVDEESGSPGGNEDDGEDIELASEAENDDALDLEEFLDPDDEALADKAEADTEADDELPQLVELEDEREERDHHVIPPMTEEEETINMLIDQDLLAIAHEDDEGFTSTIVFGAGHQAAKVESVVIGELEDEADDDAEAADAIRDDDAAERGEDSVILGLAEGEDASADKKSLYPMLTAVAVVVLALGLVAQAVHQQRESLATNPAVSSLITPIYAAIGMPITPNWDVGAWDIARTRGATDDEDRLLTIYSEIRNTSDKPLPYPIVTLSLTDRFQDPVGALVLEPADYLSSASTVGDRVQPGARFEARIPINEPSPDAIGYTINTCYRTASGDLRCAVDDFR